MTRLYRKLVNLLAQKIVFYEEFITLLQREWGVIAEYSLEHLREITSKKERLLRKMEVVETSRIEVLRALAGHLGVPCEDLSLRKLLELRADPMNERLVEYRRQMLERIATIKELTARNKGLIDHSSAFLEKTLAVVHTASETHMASYHAGGRIRGNRMESRILNVDV